MKHICELCAWELSTPDEFNGRRLVALHLRDHHRQEHRRAQWRHYSRLRRGPAPDAALHALGCSGPPHRPKPSCRPIPLYVKAPDAA